MLAACIRRIGPSLGALAFAIVGLRLAPTVDVSAQARGFFRGGGGTSTSRVASPAVVASWVSHQNYADGTATTLLVLWRGTPGWFSKGSSGGGGSSSGAGSSGSYAYEYVWEGGLTFMMEFDYDRRIVRILDQEFSLDAVNTVLVDSVDSVSGPAVVGSRWIDPLAAGQASTGDAISAIVKRTPELFDYLRCDLTLPDPAGEAMMRIICGQMRP